MGELKQIYLWLKFCHLQVQLVEVLIYEGNERLQRQVEYTLIVSGTEPIHTA